MKINMAFRFDVNQIGPREIEIIVPTSAQGMPILNPSFAKEMKLSDGEIQAAEHSVIREIAVIR